MRAHDVLCNSYFAGRSGGEAFSNIFTTDIKSWSIPEWGSSNTCDMYMCRLRHINDPVLSSLKMEGIRLLFYLLIRRNFTNEFPPKYKQNLNASYYNGSKLSYRPNIIRMRLFYCKDYNNSTLFLEVLHLLLTYQTNSLIPHLTALCLSSTTPSVSKTATRVSRHLFVRSFHTYWWNQNVIKSNDLFRQTTTTYTVISTLV
jgi:hypothetical protein